MNALVKYQRKLIKTKTCTLNNVILDKKEHSCTKGNTCQYVMLRRNRLGYITIMSVLKNIL